MCVLTDPCDLLFSTAHLPSSPPLPTCRCRHPLPRCPSPCPFPVLSPCQALCSSSVPKTLRSPTTLASTTTHVSPCHLVTLVIVKSHFPYLSLPLHTFLYFSFFAQSDDPSTNTVNALTMRPQLHPLRQPSLPLKIEYRMFLLIHCHVGLSPAKHIPFFSIFPYSQLFVAYLFYLAIINV